MAWGTENGHICVLGNGQITSSKVIPMENKRAVQMNDFAHTITEHQSSRINVYINLKAHQTILLIVHAYKYRTQKFKHRSTTLKISLIVLPNVENRR